MRVLALALTLLTCAAFAAETDYRYDAPARLIAIGDVHGAYDALGRTLHAAGVIDANQHWSGGKTVLVSVGDLLDRGPGVRKVLDLLMRLEGEAAAAGGQVHVLYGNHEVMNISGELRDATALDFAEFAADESAEERQQAIAAWRAQHADDARGDDVVRAEFDRQFPAGWFARRREFGTEGRYGRWLLSHPVAIAIGDTAFVHGGFSGALAGYDLARLNREFRAGMAQYLDAIKVLEGAGWIDFSVSGEDRGRVVAAHLEAAGSAVEPVVAAAANTVTGFDKTALFGLRGPVWYRGLAMCRALTEEDVTNASLAGFGVKRIAIGHTPTPSLRPTERLGGKVLMLDTGMLKAKYGGSGYAVQIDASGIHAIDEDGATQPLVVDSSPLGAALANGKDALLETVLREAPVPAKLVADGDRSNAQLEYQGKAVQAWFFPDRGGRGSYRREIAAFKLDRLLQVGLVPVTVAREIDGKAGALQWHPDSPVGSVEASKGTTRLAPWCESGPQLQLLQVWDALLYNEGRTLASINWDPATGSLLASDHRSAFSTRKDLPPRASGKKLQVGPALCRRLVSIDKAALAAALADSVSAEAQSALLARRDRIVADAGCAVGH